MAIGSPGQIARSRSISHRYLATDTRYSVPITAYCLKNLTWFVLRYGDKSDSITSGAHGSDMCFE